MKQAGRPIFEQPPEQFRMAKSTMEESGGNVINPRVVRAAAHISIAGAILCLAASTSFGASAPTAGDYAAVSDVGDRRVPSMEPPAEVARQMSTHVTGVLTARSAGPLANHELHFQSRLTNNLYTVRTGAGGVFSTTLPSGIYDLRGEHGAIIAKGVVVGQTPVDLGQVHPPAPYDVRRFFDWQYVAKSLVHSPAPATAYVPGGGATPVPVAVTPVRNPPVIGGGPNGQPLAPAEVMSPQVEEQTATPPAERIGQPPSGTATDAGY
jgi:hypothetical protein